ncbi:MAG: ribonucleoside-diphosphate reductase, adenosylcobalamin-dependent, partial [Acidobacteria bacterium]|nr:ribonucleoside-diphosphate reductase, adenosylcobalamin-dependent [Acidobacteriota bacterium]
EIVVDFSHYPTPRIAANSHDYRPLGLGYANLGALLMASGLPYDSAEGRACAAAITALMCGEAYLQSARIAEAMGPFPGYPVNREPMLEVVGMHRDAAHRLPARGVPAELRREAVAAWDGALELGTNAGFRNSQVTVLAPTGTIGFMMDCDTTGIEPDLALVKIKRLVGGGTIKIVNGTVPRALDRLGYSPAERDAILAHLEATGTVEGAPGIKDEHLPVFDCAFKPVGGERYLTPLAHLRMMGAVQPFLSGAISKTVNIPEETPPEEIERLYVEGWKLGLKSIAVYRDNCKGSQPLGTSDKQIVAAVGKPTRRKLPDERVAITHKFSVEGQEGYVTVGLYEDGKPGELFITMAKEGSTLSGVMDAFATAVSLTLQYGVPLEFLVNKFSHVRFEPSGWTNNAQIPYAKSVIDYIFRWMASKFLSPEEQAAVGVHPLPADESKTVTATPPRCSSTRPTRRRARPAAWSWSATAPATSAATAAPCTAARSPNGPGKAKRGRAPALPLRLSAASPEALLAEQPVLEVSRRRRRAEPAGEHRVGELLALERGDLAALDLELEHAAADVGHRRHVALGHVGPLGGELVEPLLQRGQLAARVVGEAVAPALGDLVLADVADEMHLHPLGRLERDDRGGIARLGRQVEGADVDGEDRLLAQAEPVEDELLAADRRAVGNRDAGELAGQRGRRDGRGRHRYQNTSQHRLPPWPSHGHP